MTFIIFLLFIVICIFYVAGSVVNQAIVSHVNNAILNSQQRTLTWQPSTGGGLFSHFFQVRYINSIANKFNRTLVIAPHTSIHATDDVDVIMCDVLVLKTMDCVSVAVKNKKKCAQNLDLDVVENELHACFGGHNIWGKISLYEVMSLGPRLIFQKKYVQIYEQVRTSFLKSIAAHPNYLVIHWRRGDQLTTRCLPDWKGYLDNSMNCKSAAHLVADIKRFLSGKNDSMAFNVSTILVATNERNATVLDHLRSHNFIPFSDLLRTHYRPTAATTQMASNLSSMVSLSSLDEFIVEAQFMLHAPLFVSYGISQINDVIESERNKSGRSYCIKKEEFDHKSWCEGLRYGRHLSKSERQRLSGSLEKPVKPPAAPSATAATAGTLRNADASEETVRIVGKAKAKVKAQHERKEGGYDDDEEEHEKDREDRGGDREKDREKRSDKRKKSKNKEDSSTVSSQLSQMSKKELQQLLKSRTEEAISGQSDLSAEDKQALVAKIKDSLRAELKKSGKGSKKNGH